MLVSDKYGFLIATPTKCGTTSLQGLVKQWQKLGGKPNVLRLIHGEDETKHRMVPLVEHWGYDRHIVVRDPRDRLCSMYEWLRRKPVDEPLGRQILAAEERGSLRDGWGELVRAITAIRDADNYFEPYVRRKGSRRPYMWTDNQGELRDLLQGIDADGSYRDWYTEEEPTMLLTGNLELDWHGLLDGVGPDEDELWDLQVKQLNSTKAAHRLAERWEDYWNLLKLKELNMANALVMPDLEHLDAGWV